MCMRPRLFEACSEDRSAQDLGKQFFKTCSLDRKAASDTAKAILMKLPHLLPALKTANCYVYSRLLQINLEINKGKNPHLQIRIPQTKKVSRKPGSCLISRSCLHYFCFLFIHNCLRVDNSSRSDNTKTVKPMDEGFIGIPLLDLIDLGFGVS